MAHGLGKRNADRMVRQLAGEPGGLGMAELAFRLRLTPGEVRRARDVHLRGRAFMQDGRLRLLEGASVPSKPKRGLIRHHGRRGEQVITRLARAAELSRGRSS